MKRRGVRVCLVVVALLVATFGGFVSWVELKGPRDFSAVPLPAIAAVKDPDVIARGRAIATGSGHCVNCHAPHAEITKHQAQPDPIDDLSGGSPIAGGAFGRFYPANLTPDEDTGIAKLSDGQIARAIRHGVLHDGRLGIVMVTSVGDMSDADLVAIVSYLRSLPPVKNAVPRDDEVFAAKAMAGLFEPRKHRALADVAPEPPSVERGRYLAEHQAMCIGCHSNHEPLHPDVLTSPPFAGGVMPPPHDMESGLEFASPNLTPEPTTGHIASWTEEQFVARFRLGRAIVDSPMPWECFSRIPEDDVRSIYRYLRTVPPVVHQTGPVLRKKGWKPGDPA